MFHENDEKIVNDTKKPAAKSGGKKQKEPARILLGAAIALILAAIAATFAITMTYAESIFGALIPSLSPRAVRYSAIQELDEIVSHNFYKEVDNLAHITQLEIGFMKGLNDPRSRYLTTAEYRAYQQRMRGNEPGAGMLMEFSGGNLLITHVFPSSPASKSGLRAGDIITQVDDTRVTASNTSSLMARFSEGGTLKSLDLQYIRKDKENVANVMLSFSNPTVYSEIHDEIGYLRIYALYEKTASEMETAIDDLRRKGANSLVFDVRGVSEGTVESAAAALDILCPIPSDYTSATASLIDKRGDVMRTFSSDADQISMDMAVIVDGKTDGPAELFAVVLRDFGKAVLVGGQTAGNDTTQEIFPLKDGGAILLTVARVRPYRTESYADGLIPDHAVALSDANKAKLPIVPLEEDAQVQAAFELFAVPVVADE
ncbi:MAG: S41 family peptidase [Oscillospiraceae bacterium]|nr:S41 family peptidase [Oscillospiraceae bacterium]